jgi:hypothetical protein
MSFSSRAKLHHARVLALSEQRQLSEQQSAQLKVERDINSAGEQAHAAALQAAGIPTEVSAYAPGPVSWSTAEVIIVGVSATSTAILLGLMTAAALPAALGLLCTMQSLLMARHVASGPLRTGARPKVAVLALAALVGAMPLTLVVSVLAHFSTWVAISILILGAVAAFAFAWPWFSFAMAQTPTCGACPSS